MTANDRPILMPTWQRWVAGALGVALLGVGIYAVLVKANDIGSASLVIVGAGLAMIAVQGTRIVRLGGSAANMELEQPVVRILEQAEREEDPAKAEGLVEAAAIIDPKTTQDVQSEAMRYEDRLERALRTLRLDYEAAHRVYAPDFKVRLPGDKRVLIDAKYRRTHKIAVGDVMAAIAQVTAAEGAPAPLLIVTNKELSARVREFNAEERPDQPPVEVVTWNGEEDTPLLQRAIARTAR